MKASILSPAVSSQFQFPQAAGTIDPPPSGFFFATFHAETEGDFAKLRAEKLRNRPKLSKKSPKLRLRHFSKNF